MDIEDVITTLDRDDFGTGEGRRARITAMIRVVHPDVCQDLRASDTFRRLIALRNRISPEAREPSEGSARIVMTSETGKRFAFRPLSDAPSDIGRVAVLSASLTEIYEAGNVDLADRAAAAVEGFRFADEAMRREMSRFLPGAPSVRRLDSGVMLSFRRGQGFVLLRDAVAARGPLTPETAAWVVSGLMNLCCWLGWSGVQHGAISPESVMLDPETHEVALIGGWGFATAFGERPEALPSDTISAIPALGVSGAGAAAGTDTVLVRRTLLRVTRPGELPAPVRVWARGTPAKSAVADYASWKNAAEAAWGKPRFVDAGFSCADVYK